MVIVQSAAFDDFRRRVMVPLVRKSHLHAIHHARFKPTLTVEGIPVVLHPLEPDTAPWMRAWHHSPATKRASVGQCLKRVPGIVLDRPQQCLGRAGRFTPTLLPVAQRPDLHVDDLGELGLRQAGHCTNFPDLHGIEVELAGRRTFATDDLVHLLRADITTGRHYTQGEARQRLSRWLQG